MATTDDSMDDDVFETIDDTHNQLNIHPKIQTASSTGYRNYQPPAEVLKLCEEDVIENTEPTIHKVSTAIFVNLIREYFSQLILFGNEIILSFGSGVKLNVK